MGVPRSHHTRSRRNKRRAQIFLKKPNFVLCPKCGKQVLPHTVCLNCGYYKGAEVINVLEKLTKKERKKREKEMKLKEMEERGEAGKEKSLSWEGLSKK